MMANELGLGEMVEPIEPARVQRPGFTSPSNDAV